MNRHFFKRHQGRGSYDLFSSYSHYSPGLGGMFALLLLFLAGALLGNLVVLGVGSVLGSSFTEVYGNVISYPIMFIPAMLYASVKSRLGENMTQELPLDRNDFGMYGGWKLAFTAVFATIATAYLSEPLVNILPPMPQWLEDVMKKMLEDSPLWVTLISVSVFAPFFEEWLCRGIVLRGLLTRMHPVSAIAISSAFFAILHMNPWQAIPAFILGSLFGYVYYKTGSLKLTMLMHCANNTLAAVLAKVPSLKDAETFMDILSPWAYWCIYAACLVILLCSVIIFRNVRPSLYPFTEWNQGKKGHLEMLESERNADDGNA